MATPERIVRKTEARKNLTELLNTASEGTPVTIVTGPKLVTMVARNYLYELIQRVQVAEETAMLLADQDSMRKIRESLDDIRDGRGVEIDEAAKLLGLEE